MKLLAKMAATITSLWSVAAFAHSGHPAVSQTHTHGIGGLLLLLVTVAVTAMGVRALMRRDQN